MTSPDRTFLLDDRRVPFRKGETILAAARRAGIYIPALCYHRRTGIIAGCRICVVEIEGREGLHPSCSSVPRAGMIARSESPDVRAARRAVMDLLLRRGDHDCPSCHADRSCELQEAALYLGMQPKGSGHRETPDQSAPFIVRFPDKCILCGRCVAACGTTVVHDVLSLAGRSDKTRIICDTEVPMGESSCVQCGECVQVCPTGALADRRSFERSLSGGAPATVRTICPYCGVGCGITLEVAGGRIVDVAGTEKDAVNDGMLCVKGRYGLSFVTSVERLTDPLLRGADGSLRKVPWRKALEFISRRIGEIVEIHGADAVAGLSSAKCTNEENYLFQKLFRAVIGTNNIDHCARLCHSSTVTAMAPSIGSGAMTNSMADMDSADVIFIIGSNTTAAHPVLASLIKRSVKQGRTRLMVADPKRTGMADRSTLHLRHRPGTDVALLNGLAHVIIRDGLADRDFIAGRTTGFDDFAAAVEPWSPGRTAAITALPAAAIEEAARLFGGAGRGSIYYAMGITQHTSGTDNVRALVNLQLLCGNFGRKGTGLNPLRGQCNVQGACDMGALPDLLPGYAPVADGRARRRFERSWKTGLSHRPGLKAMEMIDAAAAGALKGLYIVGENPCLSDPHAGAVRQALSSLEFLAVQDIFRTETAALAHIVLPAASFAEKDGHFTSTERRVQRIRRALPPPGNAREDLLIFQQIATALGAPWPPTDAAAVHEEARRLVPSYRGITWERTEKAGVQWPAVSPRRRGTAILHRRTFPAGRAPFAPLRWSPPAEETDGNYPFLLTTGRLLPHFHTGTMTRKEEGLDAMAGPMIVCATEDCRRLGIAAGDIVEAASRRGKIRAPAVLSDALAAGLIFIPFHFHEAPANELTIAACDERAGIPEFKVCAARLTRVSRPRRKS